MGSRSPLTFRSDDLRILSDERYAHPDPPCPASDGSPVAHQPGRDADASGPTGRGVEGYGRAVCRDLSVPGVAGLREFHWVKPVSVLEGHRGSLEESFRKEPPHAVAEACVRIQALTGVERGESQVRAFLKRGSA